MRITRRVFHDLAIWMVTFGLSIGVVFPFFVVLLGVPSDIAFKKVFFRACLGAGALAGIINYGLARLVVGVRLRVLVPYFKTSVTLFSTPLRGVKNKKSWNVF